MREGWLFLLSTEIINQSIIGIEEFYLSQTEDYSLEACFLDDYEKQSFQDSLIFSQSKEH